MRLMKKAKRSTASRKAPSTAVKKAPATRTEGKGHLVALGASAGGLKALGDLLAGLPAEFPAPIVAVLHLDPDHLSHLAPLLQKRTHLRVHVARAGQRLAAGSVYVAPPDRHLEVRDGRVALTRAARVRFSRPSIDRLFASVARSYGDRAVGVVLSGTGSDGSGGVIDIKSEGGLVIVQDPQTAEFSAMPANALATGSVDAALPLDGIPSILIRAIKQPPPEPTVPMQWQPLFSLLQKRSGTDFSAYREPTLRRRLQRRILATQQRDIDAYLALVRKDEDELERLHSEFLIKVSSFFRDPKEWTQLVSKVVRPIVAQASDSREVRIWSAGCGTGEEAYSLAMVCSEAFEKGGHAPRFKVFATDLDEPALATARLGVYSVGQMAGVSAARRRRHFVQEGDGWRIKKDLRKHVIFGRHDLLRDPPMASIDLLACRNVLIYFRPERSAAVLKSLVYALKPEGYLFLGRSEGPHKAPTRLRKISGSAKIFQRQPMPYRLRLDPEDAPVPHRSLRVAPPDPTSAMSTDVALRAVVGEYPAVVLFGVDSARRVVLWNAAAATFFDVRPPRAMGMPVADVVGQAFWTELRRAMKDVGDASQASQQVRVAHGRPDGDRRYLDLNWIRFSEGDPPSQRVLFLGVDATERHHIKVLPKGRSAPVADTLVQRRSAEAALESANKELETLNEELQSTSEEQQTLNEELESRNEELQTVNEELQSLNEELNTLNDEVGVRIAEMERIASYLRTILDLAPSGVIGCDARHRITLWNTAAKKQFHLSEEQVIGKELFDLVPVLDVTEVRKLLREKRSKRSVTISKGPGHRGTLDVDVRLVRDRGGRLQGYCLRVSERTR